MQSRSPAAPKVLKMATPEILAGPWKISAGQPHAASAHLHMSMHSPPSRTDTRHLEFLGYPPPKQPALLVP